MSNVSNVIVEKTLLDQRSALAHPDANGGRNAPQDSPQSKEVLRLHIVRLVKHDCPTRDAERSCEGPWDRDAEAESEVACEREVAICARCGEDTVEREKEEELELRSE